MKVSRSQEFLKTVEGNVQSQIITFAQRREACSQVVEGIQGIVPRDELTFWMSVAKKKTHPVARQQPMTPASLNRRAELRRTVEINCVWCCGERSEGQSVLGGYRLAKTSLFIVFSYAMLIFSFHALL